MGALTKLNIDASVDNIAISDGTDTLAINADGSLNATVTATDLDIRDLVNTQDSVAIGDETNLVDMAQNDAAWNATGYGFPIYGVRQDAGGSPVSATGDAHPLVFNDDGELKVAADLTSSVADDAADAGNPIKIGGRGLDQGSVWSALSAADDRFDMVGDLYRRVLINDAPNIGLAQGTNAAVDDTVGGVNIIASPQAGRTRVYLRHAGGPSVTLGASGVVSGTGLTFKSNEALTLPLGEALDLYAITASGTATIEYLQFG